MLPPDLFAIHEPLQDIAHSWLAAGATAVHLHRHNNLITSWGKKIHSNGTPLQAAIPIDGSSDLLLSVHGLASNSFQQRLTLDAELLQKLIDSSREVDVITEELVNTQDQLLALYDVTAITRNQTTLRGTIRAIMLALSHLLPAEKLFFAASPRSPKLYQEVSTIQYPANSLTPAQLTALMSQALTSRSYLLANNRDQIRALCGSEPTLGDNLLIQPLIIKDESMAIIGGINSKNGSFDAPAIKLLTTISQHAESQIEKALLYKENLAQVRMQTEMELAQKVQLQLLPRQLPTAARLELAAHSRPAREVGGDFYDATTMPDYSLIFTVGDVTGKGMPAAMVMAMLRTVMRSAGGQLGSNPQAILAETNRQLYGDFTDVGMFATVFTGSYQPNTETLIYANAGHSPVILCRAGHPAELLVADGTAVGVLPTSLAENQTMRFAAGDVLVIATDGFSEARNPAGHLFGYERLLSLIGELAACSATEIADALFDRVAQYSDNHPQDDDQTLLVLKRI